MLKKCSLYTEVIRLTGWETFVDNFSETLPILILHILNCVLNVFSLTTKNTWMMKLKEVIRNKW